MKYLKYLPFAALCASPLFAQATTTVFDSLTEVTDDASIYFGVIVALAVLVTGFFLGRRWLRSV